MFPLIILVAVFLLIAVRQVGRFRFQIWQVMCGGAAAVLLTGGISPAAAMRAIDYDVMLFLFGMFAAGQVLELSGWLAHAKYEVFKRVNTERSLLLLLVFFMGIASAFLMNDTLAIIGTPVVLAYRPETRHLAQGAAAGAGFLHHRRQRDEPNRQPAEPAGGRARGNPRAFPDLL